MFGDSDFVVMMLYLQCQRLTVLNSYFKHTLIGYSAVLIPTPTILVGMGRIFESMLVCLFVHLIVRSITQKQTIPMCSNLVQGIFFIFLEFLLIS